MAFRPIESELNLIQTPLSTTKGINSSKLSERQKNQDTFTSSSRDSGSKHTNEVCSSPSIKKKSNADIALKQSFCLPNALFFNMARKT